MVQSSNLVLPGFIFITHSVYFALNIAVLRQIVTRREPLLKRVFLAEGLPVDVTDKQISFPRFPFTQDADEVNAYTEFIAKLCEMARWQKRVMPTTADTDNGKYTFRCFLLRLGFIGREYKAARKVLLKNLTGNSAFRYGEPSHRG